ncbi:Sec-independent protein translocase protein TatC [Candidatus Phycosocius bacilliformis]|uniref:Sec-independent protein translocase protein TatC n=1 Tax=Candidatus Phycosocius bacilliformis TaxID=1445552 RepID=A0A2P2EAP6_9PROT|nr:twin-arginine translocase subunit TatC [Candidatus Phycosocius bacilliformis]GBF58125.1 Sec-independent protein translocase protein TatC [Candidatus Phycosocius bacilliformis]
MSDLVPQSEIPNPPLSADEAAIEATRAPLMDHLLELRDRLIWSVASIAAGFAICFAVWHYLLAWLLMPYENAVIAVKGADALKSGMGLIYTAPLEAFITQIRVALFGGICLAFPMISFQLYRFVAPGLYSHEKRAFVPFLVMAPVLFTLGAAMAYFVVMPMVMQFSLRQELAPATGGVGVVYQGKISEYVGMITTLILGFGACFQLPVVQVLLGRAGLVDGKTWLDNGRYAIFGIFVVAAVVTPPDIISQFSLAVPLVLLYYIGAFIVRLGEPKDASAD